jgi:ABC-type xylose transport system permease subunit
MVFRPMKLYHDVSGWTLVFAVLVCAVICYAFGIWMGWLSTH